MRIILVLLAIVIGNVVFAAETGSPDNPIFIESETDLAWLRDAINENSGTFKGIDVSNGAPGLHFKLRRDLDLSRVCGEKLGSWTPIGSREHPFRGNFDGNGKTIDHLYIYETMPDAPDEKTGVYGLFGSVESDMETDIEIANVVIGEHSIVYVERDGPTGAVAGRVNYNVTLSNCINKGSVTGRTAVGGIVGSATNTPLSWGVKIRNCKNEGLVNSSKNAGGIAGFVHSMFAIVDGCSNFGPVFAADTAAGIIAVSGITGAMKLKVSNVVNKGNVTSGKIAAGIIASAPEGRTDIESAFNAGNIQASSTASGIISDLGALQGPNISQCVNSGDILAGDVAGGIVGVQKSNGIGFDGIIQESLNIGVVKASMFAGGIVGRHDYAMFNVSYCMNTGIISANNAGGIAGKVNAKTNGSKSNLSVGAFDKYCIFDSLYDAKDLETNYSVDYTDGLKTDSLVSGNVIEPLETSFWEYKKGFYPQIKSLLENSIQEIRETQAIASTPMFLSAGDKTSGVGGDVGFTLKDVNGGNVSLGNAHGNVSFVNDSVAKPYSLGEDTLYISNGKATKKVFVYVDIPADFGTVANPITISSVSELVQFRDALENASIYKGVKLDGHGASLAFKLTNDLDMSEICGPGKGNWIPIKNFKGSFNGGNHRISNLYIDDTLGVVYGGLFSLLNTNSGDTTYIENIVFNNLHLRVSGENLVGAIASDIGGGVFFVRNISVEGHVQGEASTGSLIGIAHPSYLHLQGNYAKGTIVANKSSLFSSSTSVSAGGLVGSIVSSTTVSGNKSEVNIIADVDEVGGIAGTVALLSIIENNINEGVLTASNGRHIGGLFGAVANSQSFAGNHNKGKIYYEGKNAAVAGIAGLIYASSKESSLESAMNEGDIAIKYVESSFENDIGGFFGKYSYVKGPNLLNKGNISITCYRYGEYRVGGIFARSGDLTTIDSMELRQVSNEGNIELVSDTAVFSAYVGGIAGNMDLSYIKIQGAVNRGGMLLQSAESTSGIIDDGKTGGIVGNISSQKVNMIDCLNYGNISIYGGSGVIVGGAFGRIFARSSTVEIENCGNEGDIYATDVPIEGGLVGLGFAIHIKDSYNSGTVYAGYEKELTPSITSTSNRVGGLVGYIDAGSGELLSEIENSVNIGDIVYESMATTENYVGVGGILGSVHNQEVALKNIANYGFIYTNISQPNLCLVGILGFPSQKTDIENAISAGPIMIDSDNDGMAYGSILGLPVSSLETLYNIKSVLVYGYFQAQNQDRYSNGVWDDIVVDNQWNLYDTSDIYIKRLTIELTADSLPSQLNAEVWVNEEGFYPQLKALKESANESVRAISALGAVPVYLSAKEDDVECATSVSSPFRVVLQTPNGSPVTWDSKLLQVAINNNLVSFKALDMDTVAVLSASSGRFTRHVGTSLVAQKKKDLDFSKTKWNYDKAYTYNGKVQSVVLTGLPAEVEAVYTDNAHSVPGTYVAHVEFQYDSASYRAPNFSDSLVWTIAKANLGLSSVRWSDSTVYNYDGAMHGVRLKNVPNQVSVDYVGAIKKDIGYYHARAMLRFDTALFKPEGPDYFSIDWEIREMNQEEEERPSLTARFGLSNPVRLFSYGTGIWVLEFSGKNVADFKVNVFGINGEYIPARIDYSGNRAIVQDIPLQGIYFVRVTHLKASYIFILNSISTNKH